MQQSFDAVACFVVNTLRPRQNCRHFTDNIFKCIFLNEKAERGYSVNQFGENIVQNSKFFSLE